MATPSDFNSDEIIVNPERKKMLMKKFGGTNKIIMVFLILANINWFLVGISIYLHLKV